MRMDFSIPSPFEWNSSFDVKNEELNTQHKNLFVKIAALESDQSNAALLKDLMDYVVLHFDTEEAKQQAAGVLSDDHKGIHTQFLQDCGKVTAVNADTINFLKGWLVKHIKASDIPDYAGRL